MEVGRFPTKTGERVQGGRPIRLSVLGGSTYQRRDRTKKGLPKKGPPRWLVLSLLLKLLAEGGVMVGNTPASVTRGKSSGLFTPKLPWRASPSRRPNEYHRPHLVLGSFFASPRTRSRSSGFLDGKHWRLRPPPNTHAPSRARTRVARGAYPWAPAI
ncbi:hypothetical protein GQ53DRAFT_546850 [Thozetella sp. PMI_491]|nr:hypothetical protein GQ53DRAFT_546850 [Thozetella sp. PMI_491]